MPMKDVINLAMAHVHMQLNGKKVAIPYLQGTPGIGKTEMLLEESIKKNMNMFHIHFGLIPIEEISGIPIPKDIVFHSKQIKGTDWTLPEILSKSYERASDKPVLIFIDDVHLCPPSHIDLMFEMFTEKAIRGFSFPKNSAFILAGNNSAKAGTKVMSSPITNRCAIYPIEADFDYWKANYAIRAGVNKKVLSFLSNERYQQKYFVGEELVNNPWPSPRSWVFLGNIINEMEDANIKPSANYIAYCARGHVGNEAAADFSAFYSLYSETEIDAVFDGKKKIKIPENNSGKYVYGISAVNEYCGRIIKFDKDKKKINDNVAIFADIIIEISKTASEIGFAMIKETFLVEKVLKKDMQYTLIKNTMRSKDPLIESKITSDIITSSTCNEN